MVGWNGGPIERSVEVRVSRSRDERMMRELARVLKSGSRVTLADFIFTDDCVKDLARFGVDK